MRRWDVQALHGGEEYELIIVAPELPAEIEGIPLSRIGEIIDSPLDHQLFLIDGTRESVLESKRVATLQKRIEIAGDRIRFEIT